MLRNYEGAKPERLEELILQLFVVAGLLAMILGRVWHYLATFQEKVQT